MLKKLLFTFAASFVFVSLYSCSHMEKTHAAGSRLSATKKISVPAFAGVSTARAVDLIYVPDGKAQRVTATGSEEYLSKLVTEVRNGVLHVTYKGENVNSPDVVVTVTGPVLTSFDASSASSITVTEDLDAGHAPVSISASSAASVDMKGLKCSELKADASSAGSIAVAETLDAGKTDADISVSSAASVDMAGLKCRSLNVNASSASSVNIGDLQATAVKAGASSEASIELDGKCSEVDFDASSGAKISTQGLRADNGKASVASGASVKVNVKGNLRTREKDASSSVSNAAK